MDLKCLVEKYRHLSSKSNSEDRSSHITAELPGPSKSCTVRSRPSKKGTIEDIDLDLNLSDDEGSRPSTAQVLGFKKSKEWKAEQADDGVPTKFPLHSE